MKRTQKTKLDIVQKEKFIRQQFPVLLPKNDNQAKLMEGLKYNSLVVATGSSGTGKTFIACAHAAKKLHYKDIEKIVLIRAYQPLAGRSIGFLPGTLEEKLIPYYQQMLDYLEDFLGKGTLEIALKNKTIEICSLETIRGRSWENAIVLADECFKGDTQVLTDKGWVNFNALEPDTKVAAVREDKSVFFETPSRIVNKEYEGEMVTHGKERFKMTATAGHNAVYTLPDGSTKLQEFSKKPFTNWKVPVAGKLDNQEPVEDDWLVELTVAMQADGSYHDRANDFWLIQFSRERKIERFREIIKRSGLKYSEYEKDKQGRIRFYVQNFPYTYFQGNLKEKNFNLEEILKTGKALKFLEEAKHWDGSVKERDNGWTYCSTNEHNIKVIQTLAHLSGYSANFGVQYDKRPIFKKEPKPNYRLNVSPYNSVNAQKFKTSTEDYSGQVYCCTVSTGMIMVKQNDRVFISGNCQNMYVQEVQALTTRIGENTQLIMCGDNSGIQTDAIKGTDGLTYLEKLCERYEISDSSFTKFTSEDIVRSGIVKEFVLAYESELVSSNPIVTVESANSQTKKGR